jgi:hypothetical protein
MKRLISLLSIAVLCLAMSASIFAGEIGIGRAGEIGIGKAGEIGIGKAGEIGIGKAGILLSDGPIVLALLQLLGGRG